MISNLQSAQLDNDNPTMTIQFDCWSSQDSRRVSFLIELRVFFHWTYYMLDLVDFCLSSKWLGANSRSNGRFDVDFDFNSDFCSSRIEEQSSPNPSSKLANRLFRGPRIKRKRHRELIPVQMVVFASNYIHFWQQLVCLHGQGVARPYTTRQQDKTTISQLFSTKPHRQIEYQRCTLHRWAVWITEPLNYQIAGPRPLPL